MRDYGPPSPVYQAPYGTGTWRSYKKGDKIGHVPPTSAYTFPQCASAFSLPICEVEPRMANRSPVPPVPSVSPEVPIIGACGGHCPGFEYVCYYILQVVIFFVLIVTVQYFYFNRLPRKSKQYVLLYLLTNFFSGDICSRYTNWDLIMHCWHSVATHKPQWRPWSISLHR